MRIFANLQGNSWLHRRGAEVCLALGFSPAFAWLRPDAFDEQTFLVRHGYWCWLLACWFLVMGVVEVLLADRRFFQGLIPHARRAVVVGLAGLPMVVIAGATTNALSGWQDNVFVEVTGLYWEILLLGTMATLLAKAILPWRTESVPGMTEAPPHELAPVSPAVSVAPQISEARPEALCPLVARLPLAVRGRILCLEMEDHYVRVHTDRGSALVLLRLSDAIAQVQPVQGRQVHRSWWVSDEAVESFERTGRTGAVRLSNGARAPVSQRYLRSVEASFS